MVTYTNTVHANANPKGNNKAKVKPPQRQVKKAGNAAVKRSKTTIITPVHHPQQQKLKNAATIKKS